MKLITMMAKMCHYAHLFTEGWTGTDYRIDCLQVTSYQVACFLAQNTVRGGEGVDWDVVMEELVALPAKSEKQWKEILKEKARTLGGWKNHA